LKLKSTILIADFQKFHTICFLYIERIKNKKKFFIEGGSIFSKICHRKVPICAVTLLYDRHMAETRKFHTILLFTCPVSCRSPIFFKRLQKKYIAKNVHFSILKPFFRRHRCALFRPHSKIKKRASTRHSKHKW